MAETLASIVKEAKKIKYSLTKKLTEDDIISIWESASDFIEKQMLQKKGVAVPSFGVFTFSQKKIDVGNNKFIIIQRPVFVLSEKVTQTHSLQVTKQHTSGQIPIVPLNFTCLSNDSPFNRDTVEMSIKDVLLALSRALAAKKNIQLDFGKVGRLLITEGRVKMRFFKEFIASLDSSGGMENAFRPDTSGSVLSIMSNPTTPRTGITTPLLPRIVEPSGDDSLSLECTTPRQPNEGNNISQLDNLDLSVEPDDSASQRGRVSSEVEKLAPLRTPSSGKHSLVPKPAALFTTKEHPLAGNQLSASYPGAQQAAVNKSRPSSAGSSKHTASKTAEIRHSTSKLAVRPSTCSHSSPSGQELCYLCHQRAVRNVTVDASEERREKERIEDQMLQSYQHQKDLVALAKEFMAKTKNRTYNKEIASINMEAAKLQQATKTMKSSEFHSSYVFPQREPTPAKQLKQVEYCDQLDTQVTHVQSQRQKIQELEERLEREEQIKLSEELAKYQKEYKEHKAEKMLQYQRALAEQVSLKPTHLLSVNTEQQQHQPLFGVHKVDFSSDMLRGEKERSRKLFKEQLSVAATKQNLAKERATMEKLEEAEMLKRTRKGLIEDIRADCRRKLEVRKALEKSWDVSVREKQEKQLDELAYTKKPSLLVQQQCDKYVRCKQCQRAKNNVGESNLLCESRYISGARLMV